MAKYKLYTAVCVAALAFTAGGVHHAYAQKGAMFNPESGWTAKDLASSKKGAMPYCVAAMQFSKNTILTMAENKSGEISLAFDFGGGYFDPAAVAEVILDPGAGQQRSFRVKPRSSKAIVVKLGNDKEFMDALGRTGLMRLEIGDQSLNFNLNDIDKGLRKLSECLEGVIVVSTPNAIPPQGQGMGGRAPAYNPSSNNVQKNDYENKIRELEEKIARVDARSSAARGYVPSVPPGGVAAVSDAVPTALSAGLSAAPAVSSRASSSFDSELQLRKERAERAALQRQVEVLKNELTVALAERNAAQAAQMKISNKVAEEQVQLGKEKDVAKTLTAENDALKAQLSYTEARLVEALESANVKYSALQKSYDLAQARLSASDEKLALLQSELLVAKANAESASAAPNVQAASMEKNLDALLEEKQKVVALETDNQRLKNEMMELDLDYQSRLAKANSDYAALRQLHDDTVENLTLAKQESRGLKALLAKVDALQKQNGGVSLSEAQKLEAEYSSLLAGQTGISASASVGNEKELLATIDSMEETMKQKLARSDARYEQLQHSYDLTKASLERAGQEISTLKAELAQAQVAEQKTGGDSRRVVAQDSVNVQELLAAKQTATSLEVENLSLRAQVEGLTNSYDAELGALKSSNAAREEKMRREELQIATIRAEAERQLAEARAVKTLRRASIADLTPVPVPSRRPKFVRPVVASAGNVADMALNKARDVVVDNVVQGAAVVANVAPVVPDAAVSSDPMPLIPEMPSELPSLEPVALTPPELVASEAPVSVLEENKMQAQILEQNVTEELARKSRSAAVAYKEIPRAANVEAIETSMVEDLVPVPDAAELQSVGAALAAGERDLDSASVPLPVADHHQVAAVAVDAVASSVSGLPQYASSAIGAALQKAQITPAAGVEYVEEVSSESYQAYEWKADKVFGSAEQSDFKAKANFDEHVLSYLENTEKRCDGDFAIVPTASIGQGEARVDSYEVACVGNGLSSAAAIVFYKDNEKFTAVAHEAPAENMDATMEIRDRFVQTIQEKRQGVKGNKG